MFNPSAKPQARQKAVAELIAELNADARPILCGPWRSEVGFEALYWTPFLRFLGSTVKRFADRAAVVTRGGLAPLYREVCVQGYDLYALRDVKDVRRENLYDAQVRQQGKTIKQIAVTPWDDAVLEDAAHALNLASLYHVVHPAWMYWALAPYWEEQVGLRYLNTLTDYAALPRISMQANGLPPAYVAVKFYDRHTFQMRHPDVLEFVKHTVATIAAQCPVVLLGAGSQYDDHADVTIAGPNIHHMPTDTPPEINLQIQAAILSQAQAFVGTYGGVAQLALRLGIPSASFYAEWSGTAHAHLSLSSWLSKASKVPFVVGSLTDASFWRQVVSVPSNAAAPSAQGVAV